MTVTDARRAECTRLRARFARWASDSPHVRAVVVVGSWARDEPTMESDLDLVVLTDDRLRCVGADAWVRDVLGEPASVVRRRAWGPLLVERRLRTGTGFEVDVGFAPPSWASTDPVDPGTAAVVAAGCTPLYDPDRLVATLLTAVAVVPRRGRWC